ncbi:siphovirus Gp157 family protein [Rhodocytophaga aerolata]|uniref:Siphovirus Gp157 family protein n=1 Tax=Rhodocytophaga aerolata TaxID=455078 RepID=A0ABT8RIG6_9BACT|nr:siphovirus Gp157 family protein [Rhodocytophaga aerolata]MDO1450595.1 siphovirus Gp157 family protein [Rhodocytophaga aerolata]
MKTLLNIRQEYTSILQEIEQNEGELTPEMEDALAINAQELSEKSLAYVEFMGNLNAQNNRIEEEIKRLQNLKRKNTQVLDFLQKGLVQAVNEFGTIRTGTYTIGVRHSEECVIEDSDKVPEKFKTVKMEVQVDKLAVKKAIKAGENVPGAHVQGNQHPVVR